MCELCGGTGETRDARIMTDGGDVYVGHVCDECRIGRELCVECDFMLPAHSMECSAGPWGVRVAAEPRG